MFKQSALALALMACAALTHTNAAASAKPSNESGAVAQQQTNDWAAYLASSQQLQQQDQAVLEAELKVLGQKSPSRPAPTKEFGFDTEQPLEWFNTAEGKRIMDIILSFQTPSGGWSKRTDMAAHPRLRGQAFGVEDDYIPTFDNGATSTQVTLLARAFKATGGNRYRTAFERGLQLILSAQYPNGGWPQSFPLVGGYHDHITYNDALMHDLMVVLHSVAKGKNEFDFVTPAQRQAAQASLERALECVLKSQVMNNGVLTVWGAQHDAKTLQPAKARAYEMAALTSSESVWMLDFLMTLDNPSPAIINAVHSAAAWYETTKITGKTWVRGAATLTDKQDAPPMWARFYELGTNKPIFGDRDDSIHYEVGKVSKERREGYAWYTNSPNAVLKRYAKWAKKYPRA
ncbi:pectate lyase [Cellvibrio fontiphilus]|uniref:Pectate lyase n=1 Tax=Cellvibrio fontiphilus TaxID=1815559 RepID=A0ABV7FDX1_9GAMM